MHEGKFVESSVRPTRFPIVAFERSKRGKVKESFVQWHYDLQKATAGKFTKKTQKYLNMMPLAQ
ncbi:MAG: hypothetical protein ACOCZ6_05055 [Nanoarchaeota archaeon]